MSFHEDGLELKLWQYQIRYENISYFNIGEKVFLKSNPEVILTVIGFTKNEIKVKWSNLRSENITTFLPEMIIHYKYASLMIGGGKYKICLN